MKTHLLILLLLGKMLTFNASAQIPKGFSVGVNYHSGKILKHSDALLFDIPPRSYGIECQAHWQLYGKKDWQVWRHYPSVGLSFLYLNLGDKAVLGEGYGFFPSLSLKIFEIKTWKAFVQIGNGLIYVTRYFDSITNPKSTAIATALNSLSHFKVDIEKKITPYGKLRAGVSFIHFSNGGILIPNSGINIPAFNIGMSVVPNPVLSNDYLHPPANKKAPKRLGLSLRADLSWVEYRVPDGRYYPILNLSATGIYHLNKINRLSAGIDYEYNQGVLSYLLFENAEMPRQDARRKAKRWSVHTGSEFLFGPMSILLQAGYYLNYNKIFMIYAKPFYERLGLRVYFKSFGASTNNMHLGVYMKAHGRVAEYTALGYGIDF